MSEFDLDAVEAAVVAAPVVEQATIPAPEPEPAPTPPETAPEAPEAPDMAPTVELLDEGTFLTQWELMHDFGGGIVQSRTGNTCALGDLARGEGGKQAGKALYALLLTNPTVAKMILSTKSTFIGQLVAIGVHGASCVAAVKASAIAPPPVNNGSFQRHQDADA